MNWASSEVVTVLSFLLPGFVVAAVFYFLTSHPKPNEFSYVIQALIYTIVVQAIAEGGMWAGRFLGLGMIGHWEARIPVSVGVAVVVGIVAAFVSNRDILHGFFRWCGITKENSYPSHPMVLFLPPKSR